VDLHIERDLDVSPAELWDFVSTTAGLLSWWAPEGMTVPDYEMDFTITGAWHSVMIGSEGRRHKVSGQVTSVKPPNSVGFTWAWHDETDTRGHESHVTFTVTPLPGGRARLTLDHRNLPDDERGRMHEEGWTSSLRKLERKFATA